MQLIRYIAIGAAILLLIVLASNFDASDILAVKLIMLTLALGYIITRKLRSSLLSRNTRVEAMIGVEGKAETDVAHEGTVFMRGELWRARSVVRIPRGQRVRVIGLDGLTLSVEPADDSAMRALGAVSVFDQTD